MEEAQTPAHYNRRMKIQVTTNCISVQQLVRNIIEVKSNVNSCYMRASIYVFSLYLLL